MAKQVFFVGKTILHAFKRILHLNPWALCGTMQEFIAYVSCVAINRQACNVTHTTLKGTCIT